MAFFGLFGGRRNKAEAGNGSAGGRGDGSANQSERLIAKFNVDDALSVPGFAEYINERNNFQFLNDLRDRSVAGQANQDVFDPRADLTDRQIEIEYYNFLIRKRAREEVLPFFSKKVSEILDYKLPPDIEVQVDDWVEETAVQEPRKLQRLFDAIDRAEEAKPQLREAEAGFKYRVKNFFGDEATYQRAGIILDEKDVSGRRKLLKEEAEKQKMGFFQKIKHVYFSDSKAVLMKELEKELRRSSDNIKAVYDKAREYEGIADEHGAKVEEFEATALSIIGRLEDLRRDAMRTSIEAFSERAKLITTVEGAKGLMDELGDIDKKYGEEIAEDPTDEARMLRTLVNESRNYITDALEKEFTHRVGQYFEGRDQHSRDQAGHVTRENIGSLIEARSTIDGLLKDFSKAGAGERALRIRARQIIQGRIDGTPNMSPIEKKVLERVLANL